MPKLCTFIYHLRKENGTEELIIKKKDYGEMILYDIFYKDLFLLTLSQEGKVLLSNWEAAHHKPVCLQDKEIAEIRSFIVKQ